MSFGGFDPHGSPQHRPMGEINMVPLIDVMLVLLIVFIITAPLMTNAVHIDLPDADAPANHPLPEAVTLAIQADGSLWWNNEAVSAEAFDARLHALAQAGESAELHVHADRNARYEAIAQALTRAQRAGVRKIGFITLPPDGAGATP